jgi:hypothetical protein
MRIKIILYFLISTVFLACNVNPKHPQSKLDNPVTETDGSILAFADSINAQQETMEKQSSMIYQSSEELFYVEKFSRNGLGVSYKTHSIHPGLSEKVMSYYLKNDSLLLITENTKRSKNPGAVFEERRTYLRSNVPFKTEQRLATSYSQLQKAPFKDLKISVAAGFNPTIISDLNDALTGTNKFEMSFDELISGTDGQFINMKSKLPGSYSASIHVITPDVFIDSLRNWPDLFKDAKLNIKTKIADNESVYVPVERSITSASGLKR